LEVFGNQVLICPPEGQQALRVRCESATARRRASKHCGCAAKEQRPAGGRAVALKVEWMRIELTTS
jgi:hypothetical protein